MNTRKFEKLEKGFAVYLRNPHKNKQDQAALSMHPVCALVAPTRVSPAPATEQKQHHKNNQHGFHCCTSLVRGSWTDLDNGHLISSLQLMV
jgi:hypothetical protein